MRKINNRKSLILAAGGGKYVPNIVSKDAAAIPLGNNFYYIKGRKHSAGGVDIGADPKTGLEVEGEEVMKVTPKEVRVYSSVPFLQGNSPAELVMGGANPDAVFNAQEEFKDRNRINDDGSKYKNGGKIYDASKNYERAAKAREWTDALVGLFDPTPISGVLDIINARNNDRSNAEMVLAGLSVLPGARVLSKLTRGLGRLTKNQSLIKEGKKISDVVNRDKTLQKAISSFNQSARDGTLAERMRRREIYTPGGDIDLDRIQGEHIKNYNKAIHYFDRYNKLSDSNWANYENFAAASRGINTAVDAYNIGKESVNLVTDENKTNKKKLGGNGRIRNNIANKSDNHRVNAYINDNVYPVQYVSYSTNLLHNKINNVYNKKDKEVITKSYKKPLGGNLPTNQNDFLDTWNASRLATGRYNNQLGDGRLERQAESRNTAREFHSPIGFAMNYGKRAAIRTPSMSDTDYRKEIARNAQSMKLRLNTPETGQGVIGGAYHAPTHSSYVNQEEFAKDPTVRTHENAHASRATEQEQVISDILGSSSSSTYLRRPTEVYSRLMQFRQANNLDPNTVYDKDSFRELRKTAIDYNLINTFKEDEVIYLLNNVAMHNDPNQLNLNNVNLNTVPVYAAKYGTKRKSKMGKIISINGNVRNGLIHTPSREAFAYGGEKKPRFNGRYSKPGLHNLSLLASAIIMPKGTVDKEPEKPRRVGWADLHNRLVTADISQKSLDAKRDNTSVAHVVSETEKRTRKFSIGGRAKAKVGSDFRIQKMILNLPVGTRSNTSSSSTGGDNKQQSVSVPVASINSLDGSKVMSASDENAAMIRRNLAPTVVNRLAKNANNDLNYLPIQEDIAKTRNLDNIQFGINLGSSVMDALMSNIFVNQLHSYIPPTITAPTISNPGEIKLNEEDLKDIPAPILMAAAKLKTRYNANPQLAKIEDETRRTMRDIDRNTSNSRVGLARKQLAALRGQEAKNQVYAQKENIETELINKDKLNQQEVTARNLARYDQYNQALAAQMANRARLRLAADTANVQNRLAVSTANANLKAQADQFNAGNRINSLIHQAGIDGAKAEARANIVSSLLGNVGNAFDVWNRNKRQAKLDEETLKVLGLRAPNANKLMLRTLGINK